MNILKKLIIGEKYIDISRGWKKMNYYENLNKVINKIEENLTKQIQYKELAKIVGTSSYTLQRVFAFLTGITLTEYIRKRRLSKAAEELISTEIKIIDLSLKYQYDSPISFSNSFKKMHGVSPQNLRKSNATIKTFPKMEFKSIIEATHELEYRVIELEKQRMYGISTGVIKQEDSGAIQRLFEKSREEKIHDFIIDSRDGKALYYGATLYEYDNEISKKMQYYILGKTPRKDFVSLEIPKATWACFKLNNKKQEDILKLYEAIYTKWLPSSEYKEILNAPQLEIYYENYCEICIPVQ